MKVLLIGHNGLIGNSIKNSLTKFDIQFVKYKRKHKNATINENIAFLKTENKLDSFDVCINCAGQSKVWYSWSNPQEDLISNSLFQVELLKSELVKNGGMFIYFGSDAIFSDDKNASSENIIDLKSPYSISKYAGEEYTKIFAKKLGYKFSILRPSFVVGKSFSRNILFDSIMANSNSNEFPKLHPNSKFNFIESDKMSDYIINSLINNNLKELEHIASKNDTSYSEILNFFKISLLEFKNYDLAERCLRNNSKFDENFDLNSFIKNFLNEQK